MKNRKLIILNNESVHHRKKSNIFYKRIIAATSAMTILFGAPVFLPENISYFVKEMKASAAAQTITLSTNASHVLTDSCGKNCQGHIFKQSDSNTALTGVTIGIKSGTHQITFSGVNVENSFIGALPGATMNLTLEGTNKIKAGKSCGGIYLPRGAVLTIDGSDNSSLEINSSASGAGIGGGSLYATQFGKDSNGNYHDEDKNCGTVEIRGGNITVKSNMNSYHAAIGGAYGSYVFGNGGNIIITGGKVTATASISDIGIGGAGGKGNGGTLTISSADVLNSSTQLGSNVTCYLATDPTADMISVPSDLRYTSDDMTAEIAEAVSISGGINVCGKQFNINMTDWTLDVKKVSDLEYTVSYTHPNKGTISKSVSILPCEHHELTHTGRAEAACTTDGNIDYWYCNVCQKYFSDENCENEIMLEETIIPASGHNLENIKRKESTCLEGGNIEYWHCLECDAYFSDSEAKNEIQLSDIVISINKHQLAHIEQKNATCIEDGNPEYWHCLTCDGNFDSSDGNTSLSDVVIPATGHSPTHVAEKDATCTENGNIEYWYCSDCDSYFSDNQAENKLTFSDTVIPKIAHTMTHTEKKEATCMQDGNIEYWYCSACSQYFSDSDGEHAIQLSDTVIPAQRHPVNDVDYIARKEATCTEDGNIAYWHCLKCGEYFSNGSCTNPIALSDTVIYAGHHYRNDKCAVCGHIRIGYEVYFKKPDSWSDEIYCYAWQKSDNKTVNADYPGERMQYNAETGYYYYQVPSHIERPVIIFNDGGNQSQEYALPEEGKLVYDENDFVEMHTQHTFKDNKCTFCGVSEKYINAVHKSDIDMNFYCTEEEGNWKQNATLSEDGYQWDAETKVLTLGDIYINGNLTLPYDGGTNTVIIADGANPIINGNITSAPYPTSLTVTGNGTLTAGFDNGNVGSDNILTIKGGAEVISNWMGWMTNGGIAIEDGKLNVSEYIFTEKITMTDDSEIRINISTGIGNYGNVENGFASLEKYLPNGYKFHKLDGNILIVPENAETFEYNFDTNKYEIKDKEGNLITGEVCLNAKKYPDGVGEKLAGYSLSLTGNIGVNFYMELDKNVLADKNAYMQFALPNGDTPRIMVTDAERITMNGKEYYVFPCGVAAKEMTDSITAQIILSDGTAGTKYSYTVKDYADYILNHSDQYHEYAVEVARTMLRYGKYAKAYFNGETLAADAEMNTFAFADEPEDSSKDFDFPNGVTYYGSSLILESNIIRRVYFEVSEEINVNDFNFSGKKGNYYYLNQNMNIGDILKEMHSGYGCRVIQSKTANQSLKNLCKALALYGKAIEQYNNR